MSGWIDRLRPAHFAPDLARGVRGVIAILVPFYLGRELGRSELLWAALGGWLCTLSDPGGPRSSRAKTLASFTVAGAILVAVGEAAAASPVGALVVLAIAAFGASLLRATGANGTALGTPFVVVTAIAVGTRPAEPIAHALGFAAGATWAVLLSSLLWPVWTFLPVRVALASVWRDLAAYAGGLEGALREDLPAHDPRWGELARMHQRSARAAIEAARAAALALRARRSGESIVGSNLVALLGSADAQLRLLIAFGDEVEWMDGRRRTSARTVLERVCVIYDWMANCLSRTVLCEVRPPDLGATEVAASVGPLARRLVDASLAASKVTASPGATIQVEGTPLPSAVRSVLRDDLRALRDALSVQSTFFRHAVRVTIAVVVAQAAGHAVSPEHVAWVTVTTVAVLQPYPGVTLKRASERALGTLLGGIIALLVIVIVKDPLALTLLLIPFGIAALTTRPRSHRLFVLFLTPLFVVLAERWQGDWWTAAARVGDALVGASIALIAALVFPSREQPRLVDALRAVLESVRRYSEIAIEAHVARRSGAPEVLAARREVSAALGVAEASLERALAEPLRARHTLEDALLLLTYTRRLANAITSLDVAHDTAPHEEAAREVLAYVHAVHDSALLGPKPPRPPELDPSVSSHELLARIVRQAELLGSRRLPSKYIPAREHRGLAWAGPRKRRLVVSVKRTPRDI